MSHQDDRNKRKTKLLIITLIMIISVLLLGIIFQFIEIKMLESKLQGSFSASGSIMEKFINI